MKSQVNAIAPRMLGAVIVTFVVFAAHVAWAMPVLDQEFVPGNPGFSSPPFDRAQSYTADLDGMLHSVELWASVPPGTNRDFVFEIRETIRVYQSDAADR